MSPSTVRWRHEANSRCGPPRGRRLPVPAHPVVPGGHLGPSAPAARRRSPSRGHRPPRRLRLPARAHARVLPAGHRHGRRLHRARPRLHQGRRARRPARERDQRHHRRRRPPGVRRPRRTTKTIDGRAVTGWFTEDFTLAELKTLRAKERLPQVRPGEHAYDGRFEIPTFDEVLDLAAAESPAHGRTIGVYPETKHPTYFDSLGLSLEEPLVAHAATRTASTARTRRCSSSPSRPPTCGARPMTDGAAGPARRRRRRRRTTWSPPATRAPTPTCHARGAAAGRDVRRRGRADKDLVLPARRRRRDQRAVRAGRDAHARRAASCTSGRCATRTSSWPTELPARHRPERPGRRVAEAQAFLDAGVDGIFTDQADTAVEA